MNAIWSRTEKEINRGSAQYWAEVQGYGLPREDWNTATCPHDTGYGPCGTYTDWGKGKCAEGDKITF